jgi:hypothetical protein
VSVWVYVCVYVCVPVCVFAWVCVGWVGGWVGGLGEWEDVGPYVANPFTLMEYLLTLFYYRNGSTGNPIQ